MNIRTEHHKAQSYGSWSNNAHWTAIFWVPLPKGLVGCPCGRGDSEGEAVRDLITRANQESGLFLKSYDCKKV